MSATNSSRSPDEEKRRSIVVPGKARIAYLLAEGHDERGTFEREVVNEAETIASSESWAASFLLSNHGGGQGWRRTAGDDT
jgi:hypothetical protein